MNKSYASHIRKRQILLFFFNLIIFVIIFLVLAIVQLSFSRKAILDEIDISLREDVFNIMREGTPIDVLKSRDYPETKIAYYDANGQLIRNKGNHYDILSEVLVIGEKGFQNMVYKNKRYRVYTRPVDIGNAKFLKVVRNIDDLLFSEKVVSDVSVYVMAIGMAIGLVASVLMSFLQVVPLKKSLKHSVQFTNDVSHEINTPLAVIKSNVEEVLRKPSVQVYDVCDNLETMSREISHLQKLTADLLQLSRSDRRVVQCKYKEVSVNEMLEPLLEMFSMLAEQQDKIFRSNIPQSLHIITDENYFKRVCIIALDNAFKYTTKRDRISLDVTVDGRKIEISIKDTGIGVKKEEMSRIFRRFYRSDASRGQINGTGLGLAIALSIVGEMRGQIVVGENAPHGFSLTYSLPRRTPSDIGIDGRLLHKGFCTKSMQLLSGSGSTILACKNISKKQSNLVDNDASDDTIAIKVGDYSQEISVLEVASEKVQDDKDEM